MTANPNEATLRELRALHNLDLGALAYNAGVPGEGLTQAHVEALCADYTAHPSGYQAVLTATLTATVSHNAAPAQGARELAALGAKVRAALSQERDSVVVNLQGGMTIAKPGLSAQDAIAWCKQRTTRYAKPIDPLTIGGPATPAKPRPQPGDAVPWSDVENDALYCWDSLYPFLMVVQEGCTHVKGPDDRDLLRTLAERRVLWLPNEPAVSGRPNPTLVARDLGTDPEAWRAAMREWTANGNKPPLEAIPHHDAAQRAEFVAHGARPPTEPRHDQSDAAMWRFVKSPVADPLAPLRAEVDAWQRWAARLPCTFAGQSWDEARETIRRQIMTATIATVAIVDLQKHALAAGGQAQADEVARLRTEIARMTRVRGEGEAKFAGLLNQARADYAHERHRAGVVAAEHQHARAFRAHALDHSMEAAITAKNLKEARDRIAVHEAALARSRGEVDQLRAALKTAEARAEKAERNLQAVGDLLAA